MTYAYYTWRCSRYHLIFSVGFLWLTTEALWFAVISNLLLFEPSWELMFMCLVTCMLLIITCTNQPTGYVPYLQSTKGVDNFDSRRHMHYQKIFAHAWTTNNWGKVPEIAVFWRWRTGCVLFFTVTCLPTFECLVLFCITLIYSDSPSTMNSLIYWLRKIAIVEALAVKASQS